MAEVKLIGTLKHPENDYWDAEDYASSGARGCFEEETSFKIHERETAIEKNNGRLKVNERKEKIFAETSGRGHGAVLDQSAFVFSIENATRVTTIFLCSPEYSSHLQQSLRRATATKGFHRINDEKSNQIMNLQFKLYSKMIESEIDKEDARIILPLNTKTNIQSLYNARELMHLKSMSARMKVPLEVRQTVEKMYSQASEIAPRMMKNREKNNEVLSWMPAPQLFAKSNPSLERKIYEVEKFSLLNFHSAITLSQEEVEEGVKNRDEALLSNLKHYHFSFLAPMSLSAFHQALRQRSWNHAVEPLSSAIRRKGYITPPTIEKSKFKNEFEDLVLSSLEYVAENQTNPNVYGIIPHALEIFDLIHLNGWNAINSVGKRTCKNSQLEIRTTAKKMADEIKKVAPEIGNYSLPQGMIYGYCPERKNCGFCRVK
jgi:thymidylate synthase ThyX